MINELAHRTLHAALLRSKLWAVILQCEKLQMIVIYLKACGEMVNEVIWAVGKISYASIYGLFCVNDWANFRSETVTENSELKLISFVLCEN